MSRFNFWAVQWNRNRQYPFDIDFNFKEEVYCDIEFYGELWSSFCEPEEIALNQFFTTNDNFPLRKITTIALRWMPYRDGRIPEGFVIKNYKVIIYNDPERQNILEVVNGNFSINDPYLLDQHDWFETRFLEVTENQSIGINAEINIKCKILQPRTSTLTITIQRDGGSKKLLLRENLSDLVREKIISIPYTFNNWGRYKIEYQLLTNQNAWIDNWCPAQRDYVELKETIVNVGEI